MVKREYYEVLEVSPQAGLGEIKKAFRRLALVYHPDQGGNASAFLELKAAFEEAIHTQSATSSVTAKHPSSYDPFEDPDYDSYDFFAPENDTIAEFERSVLAEGCKYCRGLGFRTKLVQPERGFMGLQERFCICQRVQ